MGNAIFRVPMKPITRFIQLAAFLMATFHLTDANVNNSNISASRWDCQFPGSCAFCPLCPGCSEGPGGLPGGCGYCKFCDSISCSTPQCVERVQIESNTSATANCSAVNGNLQGKIVVLDVNSWTTSNGAQRPPNVTTAVQCCEYCRRTTGCNAWTFCFRPEGCGTGCPSDGCTSKNCSGLGPFSRCTVDGRYPFLTCSLKSVDLSNLTYWPGDLDWTSGVVAASEGWTGAFSLCGT